MSDLTPKVKGQKKVAHMVTCFGAATVILGALFKIMHYPGASIMLPVGLIVETGLFIYFGFDIPHEEIDWSLVYPELAGMHDDDHGHGHEKKATKKVEIAKLAPEATPYVAHLHAEPTIEAKTTILDKIKKFFGL